MLFVEVDIQVLVDQVLNFVVKCFSLNLLLYRLCGQVVVVGVLGFDQFLVYFIVDYGY